MYKAYNNLDQLLLSLLVEYSVLIAKRTDLVVRERAKCKLPRLEFHKESKMKSHFKKILGFRLFLMTLMPVGLAALAMQTLGSLPRFFPT